MRIIFNPKVFTFVPQRWFLMVEHVPPVPKRYSEEEVWLWLGFVFVVGDVL